SQVVRFPLGQVCATPGALSALSEILFSGEPDSAKTATERANATLPIVPLIQRHASGDWGDVGAEDWAANEDALRRGGRLFSVYQVGAEIRLWIITEADRSATTVVLPEEY